MRWQCRGDAGSVACGALLDVRRSGGQIIGMTTQTNANLAPFLALYERHTEPLRRYLYARLRPSDVEDVFQDVWMRAWAAWERFDGQNFRGWLFEIARNRITDVYRASNTKLDPLPVDFPGNARRVETDVVVERELAQQLTVCLEKLPKEFRLVFEANAGGEDPAELAARLKLAQGTVYTRLHRARQLLVECMNGASA